MSTTLKRDYPVKDDEKLLLARLLERSLELPVTLTVKTVPLLPPLSFDDTGALTPASTATLALIKKLPGGRGESRFILESSSRKNTKRLEAVKLYLIHEQGVLEHSIVIRVDHSATGSAGVILRIIRR